MSGCAAKPQFGLQVLHNFVARSRLPAGPAADRRVLHFGQHFESNENRSRLPEDFRQVRGEFRQLSASKGSRITCAARDHVVGDIARVRYRLATRGCVALVVEQEVIKFGGACSAIVASMPRLIRMSPSESNSTTRRFGCAMAR